MPKLRQSIALLSLCSLLGGGAVMGCSEKTELTKQEEQNFKGTGQMPAGAAAEIAKQRAAAQSKGGNGAPAESVPVSK